MWCLNLTREEPVNLAPVAWSPTLKTAQGTERCDRRAGS